MFDAIGTAGTAMQANHTWLDAIANNIANVNDTAPVTSNGFHTEYVQMTALGAGADGAGQGVAVTSLTQGDAGTLVQDPSNPMADKDGYVRRADVNLSEQMGDMIMAQRGFQANSAVIDRAKDAYESAISIGKGM